MSPATSQPGGGPPSTTSRSRTSTPTSSAKRPRGSTTGTRTRSRSHPDDRIKKLKEEEAGASGKRKRELRDEQKKLREQKAELERQNGEAGDAPDQADGTPPADVPPSKSVRKPGQSGKEAATDVPSFARGEAPRVGESGNDFAKRLMDARGGATGNYPTGPGSELYIDQEIRRPSIRGSREQ